MNIYILKYYIMIFGCDDSKSKINKTIYKNNIQNI